ncbi:type II toxin-antitoxin system VapB family antitoxin [Aquiflexum sp. TKW24L]|jgi:Arc/MetJ family transcription regulator|uniref:type II toxin-antitoxin system VapB family antitoxin n=1 Tax=Aquiflexum sp. TKW24L TaxID=2942212 RepID=UPI0020BF4937|nr:type II toxin-antitoxin system VapB family antitoxin [Aquiflexum sp. TKW24L]MCL6259553.1 type II toxin-antitoxin system VapB family antitoxin [Aquiflexum sp. TKW24L]
MRTTLEIPEDLIEEAMKLTGAKTKSQLITDALKEKIEKIKRQRLLTFKGKIDLDIDLDVLRDRK